MNLSPRQLIQRYLETPVLRRLGDRTPGARVLEVDCGSGFGTKLILDQLGCARVDALDLDPAMVRRARRRLRRYRDHVRIEQGSVTELSELPPPGEPYDAVFDLAIIHRVEDS